MFFNAKLVAATEVDFASLINVIFLTLTIFSRNFNGTKSLIVSDNRLILRLKILQTADNI